LVVSDCTSDVGRGTRGKHHGNTRTKNHGSAHFFFFSLGRGNLVPRGTKRGVSWHHPWPGMFPRNDFQTTCLPETKPADTLESLTVMSRREPKTNDPFRRARVTANGHASGRVGRSTPSEKGTSRQPGYSCQKQVSRIADQGDSQLLHPLQFQLQCKRMVRRCEKEPR